jgi:hypothetical protein
MTNIRPVQRNDRVNARKRCLIDFTALWAPPLLVFGSRIAPDQVIHLGTARLQLGFKSPPDEA